VYQYREYVLKNRETKYDALKLAAA